MKFKKLFFMMVLLTCTLLSAAQTKSSAPATAPRQVVATPSGVGPVKLLISPDKIPSKFPGLYDLVEKRANSSDNRISDAEYELKFYQNGVNVMTAYANSYTGIYGGIRCIYIPEESPLKVKVAPKQYISTGEPAIEVWTKTGKTLLQDGISSWAPYYQNFYPIEAACEDTGGDAYDVVFYVDKEDIASNFESKTEWKSSDLKPTAKIKGILIFYWVNEFL